MKIRLSSILAGAWFAVLAPGPLASTRVSAFEQATPTSAAYYPPAAAWQKKPAAELGMAAIKSSPKTP